VLLCNDDAPRSLKHEGDRLVFDACTNQTLKPGWIVRKADWAAVHRILAEAFEAPAEVLRVVVQQRVKVLKRPNPFAAHSSKQIGANQTQPAEDFTPYRFTP
jgi:hypothetical protein